MKKKKLYILISISFLLILIKSNFFKSFYEIVYIKYDDRLSKVYGFCSKEGIGYVNFLKKRFKINGKISLINSLERNNNNSGNWAIYNSNYKESEKSDYLIIINHKKIDNKINLDEFKIIHNYEDCYLLLKND